MIERLWKKCRWWILCLALWFVFVCVMVEWVLPPVGEMVTPWWNQ